tara:strand:+ start:185 stop:289 length:105 start_codon:yes stop_codon:yes gene_type:complete
MGLAQGLAQGMCAGAWHGLGTAAAIFKPADDDDA